MPGVNPATALNELLISLNRSFAMYLSYAMPYFSQHDSELSTAFNSLVTDQKHYVQKLGEKILGLNTRASSGDFPMSFTGMHDLSAHFMLKTLVREQDKIHKVSQATLGKLSQFHAPDVIKLVEEVAGNALGHYDTLKKLLSRDQQPKLTTVG
jgi:hypothetical protein